MSFFTNAILEKINQAPSSTQSEQIWIKGNTPRARDNKYLTLEQMQSNLRSEAAVRSPGYGQVVKNLYDAGFISERQIGQVESVANALQYPVKMYQAYAARAGDKAVSYNKWMDWYVSTASPRQASGGTRRGSGGGYSGPTTTTSVTLTDETTAEALLDRFARDLLGRGLNKKETDKYLKQFRKAEQASPQVTTTTPGVGSARQVTETAANKEELLRQIVTKNPDYQKFQVDTTIMDMLIDDIEKGKKVIYG
jgi:hypothetical protein